MASYSSGEAAQMLGVAPITLRKLSTAFAAWLSVAAAETTQVGEAWERIYTEDDLEVLQHGAALLRQKRDYAWARERLAVEFGRRDAASERAPGAVEEPEMRQRAVGADPSQAPDVVEAEVLDAERQPVGEAPHVVEAEVLEAEQQPAGAAPGEAPDVVDAEVIEPGEAVPPDIAVMLERMAALYQDLLRTKDQEIAALRQALDMTELAAANERRELDMLNRLARMMERENQRLVAELEEARSRLGQAPAARRGLFARLFGGRDEDAQSAPQTSES